MSEQPQRRVWYAFVRALSASAIKTIKLYVIASKSAFSINLTGGNGSVFRMHGNKSRLQQPTLMKNLAQKKFILQGSQGKQESADEVAA